MDSRKWYKGDTHLHTTNSDGYLTKGQLVERCKNEGLDFMMITDHNFNSVEESYYDGDMLIIQGQEITGENGHVNIWGVKVPEEPPYKLDTKEDYVNIIKKCHDAGATVSLNHPFCSQCGFRFDIDDIYCDSVEVWNTIQHTDNMVNRDWWVSKLLKGEKLPAVGGSDFHKDYVPKILLASPTTFVFAKSNTQNDILEAIRGGHAFVTNSPTTTQVYLTCGDAVMGDTVRFTEGITVSVEIMKLMPFNTVTVYNNERAIFSYKPTGREKHMAFTCEVREKGFVRVEVTYEYKGVMKKIFKTVEDRYLAGNNRTTGPDYNPPSVWAFTNPIYFE